MVTILSDFSAHCAGRWRGLSKLRFMELNPASYQLLKMLLWITSNIVMTKIENGHFYRITLIFGSQIGTESKMCNLRNQSLKIPILIGVSIFCNFHLKLSFDLLCSGGGADLKMI